MSRATSSAYAKPISSGQDGGGSWDTPPKAADKAASAQNQCDNIICGLQNNVGGAIDSTGRGAIGKVSDLAGGVGNGWSYTGGKIVNSAGDLKDWAWKHPGETLLIGLAVAAVAVTCYASCTAIVGAALSLGAGDIGLGTACAVACVPASGLIVPGLNLGGTLWNASNIDHPEKQVDTAGLSTIPYEFTAPDNYIPPTVTNPALRNSRGWFISPNPIWGDPR